MKPTSSIVTNTLFGVIDGLIKISGKNYDEIGEQIGVTRQSIMVWKRKDDFKISKVIQIAEACGVEVSMGMCKDDTKIDKLLIPLDSEKPLAFLSIAFSYYRYSLEEVSRITKIPKGTLYGWLYAEKCTIREIMGIAKKLGMSLFIDYKQRPENKPTTGSLGVYMSIKDLDYKVKM